MTRVDPTEAGAQSRGAARSRDLIAARTLALARRREGEETRETPTTPFLVCACGEDRFGIPLARVARVMAGRPCTPVPGADPAVSGLVALSGRIVGVVGLGRALGRPAPDDPEEGHLVVLRGEPPVALAVGRALGIVQAAAGPEAPAGTTPLGNGHAPGYVPAAAGQPDFVIVDPSPLLRRLLP